MVAILAVAMTVTTTTLSAYAQTDPQRNNFGQGASNLGQTGQMGTHSREGGSAGTAPFDGPDAFDPAKGRTGIGNLGHPADVADALCPPGSTNPLCPQ